ncbi:glycosyltransferase family 2 protein [bacterium]|nr:glycosyltransferase family 2 protein [bacterium]
MPQLSDISVVVIAKNEADQIGDCLVSCAAFPNRYVIDTGSTDSTPVLSEQMGATVIHRQFTNFRDIRAFALTQVMTEWVLFLDADERLSPAVARWLENDCPPDWTGLRIPRRNMLLGSWVKYSGWGDDAPLRLARVAMAHMAAQRVHESIEVDGIVGRLDSDHDVHIIHHTCRDLSSYMAKINHYTSIEAADRASDPAFKTSAIAILSRSIGMFTQTLFHFKGRKDGERGTILACLNLVYSVLLMIKIWELRQPHD